MSETKATERDLLLVDNARNMTPREMLQSFYVTDDYLDLLAPSNQVVLGARGSGKTTLLRMLAHEMMSSVRDDRVEEAVRNCTLIGIYVPMSATWVSSLSSESWHGDGDDGRPFRWRLNLASCIALTRTAKSCLDQYVADVGERARTEISLVETLATAWELTGSSSPRSLSDLRRRLEDTEWTKQLQVAKSQVLGVVVEPEMLVGAAFETGLFVPLRKGIQTVSRLLSLPDETMWALCLDEAEFLQPSQHKMISTHMRSHPENLVFKLSTLPYYEPSLETDTGDDLSVGHDVSYLYIDRDPVKAAHAEDFGAFTDSLVTRRLPSGSTLGAIGLVEFLGESPLLEAKREPWGPRQSELLRKYATKSTIELGDRLGFDSPEFRDQVARKIHGALILRDTVASKRADRRHRQKLDLYSGAGMVVRCTDANPRRMIQLFNRLMRAWHEADEPSLPVPGRIQHEVIAEYSHAVLRRSESEPGCGRELYNLLSRLLKSLQTRFYDRPLSTDQPFSVDVRSTDGERILELIQEAAAIGLLYPNISTRTPEFMPHEGVFHFAYVLAPGFDLLPRRGSVVRLSTLLKTPLDVSAKAGGDQPSLWDER